MSQLNRLRVLVTRPQHQSQTLTRLLHQNGAEVLALPTLAIEAIPLSNRDRSRFLNLDHYHAVIVTSTNAVREGITQLEDYWPQWPQGLHWIAVGDATAEALQHHLIQPERPTDRSDSEGILALPCLQQLQEKKILLLKGQGGRGLIADTLAQRGAQVDQVDVYRRSPSPESQWRPAIEQWQAQPPQVGVIYSGESFQQLQRIAERFQLPLGNLHWIAVSQRVADQLREKGIESVSIARHASDQGFLESIQAWYASQSSDAH